MNFESGGREAIDRLVSAYGFTTRQALADHLKVSKSTLANRYLRDTFPSDWIIQCALETGTSLKWLINGTGPQFEDKISDVITLTNKKIIEGILYDSNYFLLDKALLPKSLIKPICISEENRVYIVETEYAEITDGEWLVEIEGKVSIRTVTRVPIQKIKITGSNVDFECAIDDVKMIAKCRSILINNI